MQPLHEITEEMRGVVVQGVVVAIDDTGQAQTLDVRTHDGILRTGIEVMHGWGVASAPPIAGALVTLLAVGGDHGHYVAMPGTNHSFRFGNMVAGDGGCIYAQDGSRVFVRAGGVVEIVGFAEVHILSPGVVVDAPNGVTINGPLKVVGPVTVQGDVSVTGNETVGGTVSAQTVSAQTVSATTLHGNLV